MMSDFDEVLERLVTEPDFAGALAADPERALAGYRLSADEIELLHSQVGADPMAEHDVEVRANQSSTFGMLSPLVGMFGGGLPGIGDQLGSSGLGQAPGGGGAGSAPAEAAGIGSRMPSSTGLGTDGTEGLGGTGDGSAGDTAAVGLTGAGLGGSPGTDSAGMGAAQVDAYASDTYGLGPGGSGPGGLAGLGDQIGDGLLAADTAESGEGGLGAAPPPPAPEPPAPVGPPEGYRTRVDVDGDGEWDKHVVMGRADGGVDILVDSDGDGRVDFVGRDDNADRLVDSARYDKDGDGFFEKRMYDDDGDGWMDRTVVETPPTG
jgi:hypothetical protein